MVTKEIKFPVLVMCDRHAHADIVMSTLWFMLGMPRKDLFTMRKLEKGEKWENTPPHESLVKLGAHNECQYIIEANY